MPDLWTHIICGREVLGLVEEGFAKTAREDRNLYFLGCQGPDLFFYHNFWPWDGDGRVFSLANKIHHEKCGLFLRESLKFARINPGPRIVVYLMGFICHWCLDRITHPYINYISGIYREGMDDTRKLINNHKRVEAAIDVLMGQRVLNLKVWKTPAHKQIEVGDSLPGEVEAFYRYILPRIYEDRYEELKDDDFINCSYRQMISALKVLYDPLGIKRFLAAAYDFFSRDVLNLRYYFYKSPERSWRTYLNEEKRPWCHPVDAGEVYTDSFTDLFVLAVEESAEIIGLSLKFLRGEAGEAEVMEKFEDISYSTGKPESDRRPMRYFKPLLE